MTDVLLESFGIEEEFVFPTRSLIEENGKTFTFYFDGREKKFIRAEVRLDPKTGYHFRGGGSFDKESIKQCRDNYERIVVKDRVVLDLGANIGGFTRMALDGGAKQVISVEPCPWNHLMTGLNAPKAHNLWGGVVAKADGDIPYIYAGSRRASVSSSTQKRAISSDVMIEVPSFGILDILDQYKPEVIKCDIEGGEYELLDVIETIPSYVQAAFFEFHRSAPRFLAYPDRFFPETEWDRYKSPPGRFGSLQEILFTRKTS